MPGASRVLPGFRLSLGITLAWVFLLVLVPLAALAVDVAALGPADLWHRVSAPRVAASLRLSFGAALAAALVNAVLGLVLAWVLVRYRFPGRGLADALVDVPLALPTAVAGIALTALYAPQGCLGRPLQALGVQVAFAPAGVVVALTFVGLPFVVRTLQPVLEALDPELEEAAASLGARRGQTLRRVVLPQIAPAWVTGFALAFARGVGEYGSVVFISGNLPGRTEIAPLLIMSELEQYDYAGATAIAGVMLATSLAVLAFINLLQARAGQRARPA